MTIFNKYFYNIALFLIKNPKIKKFILLAFIAIIYFIFFCTNDIYCFDDSPVREMNNIHELEGNNHHTYELEGNNYYVRQYRAYNPNYVLVNGEYRVELDETNNVLNSNNNLNQNNTRHIPNPSHYPRDNSTMLGTIHSNPSYELGEIDNNRNDSNPKNYN
jgi:hypothetical protein